MYRWVGHRAWREQAASGFVGQRPFAGVVTKPCSGPGGVGQCRNNGGRSILVAEVAKVIDGRAATEEQLARRAYGAVEHGARVDDQIVAAFKVAVDQTEPQFGHPVLLGGFGVARDHKQFATARIAIEDTHERGARHLGLNAGQLIRSLPTADDGGGGLGQRIQPIPCKGGESTREHATAVTASHLVGDCGQHQQRKPLVELLPGQCGTDDGACHTHETLDF